MRCKLEDTLDASQPTPFYQWVISKPLFLCLEQGVGESCKDGNVIISKAIFEYQTTPVKLYSGPDCEMAHHWG